jgi:hypothetical protein
MKRHHDRLRKPARVAEPVQVYLAPPDRERLERLASSLGATKSDVLRRGLEALEALMRRPAAGAPVPVALPSFGGQGLQPGVDLDDTAGLLDLMQGADAPG